MNTHPQSWTLTHNGDELERQGHTIYRRGDGDHHWPAVCSKCRETSGQAEAAAMSGALTPVITNTDNQYFAEAESSDGLFFWSCIGPGYVAIDAQKAGITPNTEDGKYHSVYLQYGELDAAVPPELLRRARAFSCAVDALRDERRKAADAAEITAIQAEIEALKKPGARWTEPCDGSVEECSLDLCVRREDGSVARSHAF